MDIKIGDSIRILAPFSTAFPDTYTVVEVNLLDSWVRFEGEESAFDFKYVEVI